MNGSDQLVLHLEELLQWVTLPSSSEDSSSRSACDIDPKSIEQAVLDLKEALENEGMKDGEEWTILRSMIDSIKQGNTAKAKRQCSELRKMLIPFNIDQFTHIFDESENTIDAIKGRDCVVFVGAVGSGKSTVINYLLGSEMQIDSDTDDVFPQSDVITQERKSIVVAQGDSSADVQSKFVEVTGFTVGLAMEIELANVIGMARILRKAKRVKIAIVVNQREWDAQLAGLERTFTVLSKMWNHNQETLTKSVIFLVTRADSSKAEAFLKAKFEEYFNKIAQDAASDSVSVKFQSFSQIPIAVIDPMKPSQRRRTLRKMKNKVDWITDPTNAFQGFVMDNTWLALNKQFNRYQKSITGLCNEGSLDQTEVSSLIKRWLQLMRELCDIIPSVELKKVLNDCDALYSGIRESKEEMTIMLDESSEVHLSDDSMDQSDFSPETNESVKKLFDKIDSIPKMKRKVKKQEWESILIKIHNQSQSGSQMSGIIDHKIGKYQRMLAEFNDDFLSLMKKSKWKEIALKASCVPFFESVVRSLTDADESMEDVKMSDETCDAISKLNQKLQQYLSGMTNNHFPVGMSNHGITKSMIDPSRIQSILECHGKLKECRSAFERSSDDHAFVVPDSLISTVNTVFNSFSDDIVHFAEQLIHSADRSLRLDDGCKDGRLFLDACNELRKIEEVSLKTNDEYSEVRVRLDDRLRSKTKNSDRVISEFMRTLRNASDGRSIDYFELQDCVQSLVASGVDSSKKTADCFRDILQAEKDSIDALSISLDHSDQIEQLTPAIARLFGISKVGPYLPEVKQQIQNILEHTRDIIVKGLDEIKHEFDVQRYSLRTLRDEQTALKEYGTRFMKLAQQKILLMKVLSKHPTTSANEIVADLIAKHESVMETLDELEQARQKQNQALDDKIKEWDDFEHKYGEFVKMGKREEQRRLLSEQNLNSSAEIPERKEQLLSKVQRIQREYDRKKVEFEKNKLDLESKIRLIRQYSEIESDALSKGLQMSNVLKYRKDGSLCKRRWDEITKILNFDQEYTLPPLKVSSLKKSLLYLHRCEKVRWIGSFLNLRSNVKDSAMKIDSYLKVFRKLWQKKLDQNIRSVMQMNIPLTAKKKIDDLKNELSLIRDVYECDVHYDFIDLGQWVFDMPIKNKLMRILEILISGLSDLKKQAKSYLKPNNNPSECFSIIERCTLISKIDVSFIEWASSVLHQRCDTFGEYASTLESQLLVSSKELTQSCLDSFNNGRFNKLGSLIATLKSMSENDDSSNYESVCSAIFKEMKSMCHESRISVMKIDESISETDIYLLSEQLREQSQCNGICMGLLPDSMERELSEQVTHISQELCDRMEKIKETAMKAAEKHHFSEAERRLTVIRCFGRYFKGGIEGFIHENAVKDLGKEYERINGEIDGILDELGTRFSKITRLDFIKGNPFSTLKPGLLFDQMKQEWDDHIRYKQAWNRIESSIQSSMREVIKAVFDFDPKTKGPLSQKKKMLRVCRAVLKSLPHSESHLLEEEIHDCGEVLAKRSNFVLKEVDDYMNSGNWYTVVFELDEIKMGDRGIVKRIIKKLNQHCSDLIKSIKHTFQIQTMTKIESLILELIRLNEAFENVHELPDGAYEIKEQMNKALMDELPKQIQSLMNLMSDELKSILEQPETKLSTFNQGLFQFYAEVFGAINRQSSLNSKLDSINLTDQMRLLIKTWMSKVNDTLQSGLNPSFECDSLRIAILTSHALFKNGAYQILFEIVNRKRILPNHIEICEMIDTKLETQRKKINEKGLLCSNTIIGSNQDRTKYLQWLSNKIRLMDSVSALYDSVISESIAGNKNFHSQVCLPISSNLGTQLSKMRAEMESILIKDEPSLKQLSQINACTQIVRIIAQKKNCHISADFLGQDSNEIYKQMSQLIRNSIANITRRIRRCMKDTKFVVKMLIVLGSMKELVQCVSLECNKAIDDIFDRYESDPELALSALHLSTDLLKANPDIGGRLVQSHQVFEGIQRTLRTRKMVELPIDQVLQKMDGYDCELDRDSLADLFKIVNEKYQRTMTSGLCAETFENIDYKPILKEINSLSCQVSSARSSSGILSLGIVDSMVSWFAGKAGNRRCKQMRNALWNHHVRSVVPKLLGLCFGIWTLKTSACFFRKGPLLQPRDAQIVSVLCLLGLDDKRSSKSGFINNLVQIGTGEGKSVTLAMTAMVLALVGFDVSCACFSELLSQRDYHEFVDFFDMLEVKDHIHYGTFNDLFERMINGRVNIRDEVRKIVSGIGGSARMGANVIVLDGDDEGKGDRPKILLIDEVDVFFQKSFFGSLYQPSLVYPSKSFSDLIKWVWQSHKLGMKFTVESLRRSEQFKRVLREFPDNCAKLLTEAAKDVIDAAKNVESHQYIVVDGKIGYKYQDSVSFKAFKGYQTMMAYLKEFDAQSVNAEMLESQLGLFIKIASFSYAEMPAQFYAIAGVTGTLKTLTESEKKILKDRYNVRKHVYMPSLFGDSKLHFAQNNDTECVESEYYHSTLNSSILSARNKSNAVKRPVLVIFESQRALDDFEKSVSFAHLKKKAQHTGHFQILTEENTADEKKTKINFATQQGQITLATSSFGRGVDYQVYDAQINANGGMHVECAFFPPSNAEETQIKGRTARQGAKGSFHMTVNIGDLEKYKVSKNEIEEWKSNFSLWKNISDHREQRFVEEHQESTKFVAGLKPLHLESEALAKTLRENDTRNALKMLLKRNKGAFLGDVARLCIAIDATGSMGTLLNQAKNVVSQLLPELRKFLIEKELDPSMFKIKVVYYRNYNAPSDELIVSSQWESDQSELVNFMQPAKPHYGWENEALEVALAHIAGLKEQTHFVLVIGDAPANTIDEVRRKRDRRGHGYWIGNGFPQTYWLTELRKLMDKDIKVNCFYLKQRAKSNFEEIARQSGGICKSLDVSNERESVRLLKGAIADQVLTAIGGGSQELVKAYHQAHPDIPYFLS